MPEQGGDPRGLGVPADVRDLGWATAIYEISQDRSKVLIQLANPTTSDILLIEYEEGGAR